MTWMASVTSGYQTGQQLGVTRDNQHWPACAGGAGRLAREATSCSRFSGGSCSSRSRAAAGGAEVVILLLQQLLLQPLLLPPAQHRSVRRPAHGRRPWQPCGQIRVKAHVMPPAANKRGACCSDGGSGGPWRQRELLSGLYSSGGGGVQAAAGGGAHGGHAALCARHGVGVGALKALLETYKLKYLGVGDSYGHVRMSMHG